MAARPPFFSTLWICRNPSVVSGSSLNRPYSLYKAGLNGILWHRCHLADAFLPWRKATVFTTITSASQTSPALMGLEPNTRECAPWNSGRSDSMQRKAP